MLIQLNIAFWFIIFSFNSAFCMSKDFKSEFEVLQKRTETTKIKSAEDVRLFKSKIVAYITNSNYFGAIQGYHIYNKEIKYGYVQFSPGYEFDRSYCLQQLVAQNCTDARMALDHVHLQDTQLEMRLAHIEELMIIAEAIKQNKAKFSSKVKRELAFSLINAQIKNCLDRRKIA